MRKLFSVFILTVFLISAGTAIYAKTNTSQNLSKWYNGAFQQISSDLGSGTATQIIKGLVDLDKFVSESKDNFSTALAALRDVNIGDTKVNIEMRQAKFINELDETVADLQQETFEDYVDELDIEAVLTAEVEIMLEELLNK